MGSLYTQKDIRRDQGFTLFYIGINIGAFLASLIVGYVGETYGWHYGFSLAGLGMIIGQITFFVGEKILKMLKKKKVFKYKKVNRFEFDRIKLIVLASFILIIFWASFEQAGGLMNIFCISKNR